MNGKYIVNVLESLRIFKGLVSDKIQVDIESEFISTAMDKWAHDNNVILDFSRPGKPTDNPFVESFNGSFRDECLNTNWFLSLEDAREKIEAWKDDYNGFKPHNSLSGLTPNHFVGDNIRDSNIRTFEWHQKREELKFKPSNRHGIHSLSPLW